MAFFTKLYTFFRATLHIWRTHDQSFVICIFIGDGTRQFWWGSCQKHEGDGVDGGVQNLKNPCKFINNLPNDSLGEAGGRKVCVIAFLAFIFTFTFYHSECNERSIFVMYTFGRILWFIFCLILNSDWIRNGICPFKDFWVDIFRRKQQIHFVCRYFVIVVIWTFRCTFITNVFFSISVHFNFFFIRTRTQIAYIHTVVTFISIHFYSFHFIFFFLDSYVNRNFCFYFVIRF